jgi:hypothetical protein
VASPQGLILLYVVINANLGPCYRRSANSDIVPSLQLKKQDCSVAAERKLLHPLRNTGEDLDYLNATSMHIGSLAGHLATTTTRQLRLGGLFFAKAQAEIATVSERWRTAVLSRSNEHPRICFPSYSVMRYGRGLRSCMTWSHAKALRAPISDSNRVSVLGGRSYWVCGGSS